MKTKKSYSAQFTYAVLLGLLLLSSCSHETPVKETIKQNDSTMTTQTQMQPTFKNGYAPVNGLNMYYEIHGTGSIPLVLIHGGGSTIETNWGRLLPLLAPHRQVIAVELQVHGHTADADRPTSFEQDADDVAALLQHLHVDKADVMGFSNGGSTTMQLAIRHPQIVHKAIIASAFYQRAGLYPGFWKFMEGGTFADMPQIYKDAFLKVAPKPEQLMNMFKKDSSRMLGFKDWPDDMIRAITVPAMVMINNEDVVMPEHALKMARLMPKGQIVILPGHHGKSIGEILFWKEEDSTMIRGVASMIEQFLDKQEEEPARGDAPIIPTTK